MTRQAADRAEIPGYWHRGRFYPIVAGGDGTTDPPPADGGSTGGADPDPAGGDPAGTGAAPSGGTTEEPTLTQSQVNAIVAREKAQAARGKVDPKELGFESVTAFKEFIDQSKQLIEDQKTEDQKKIDEARKEGRDAALAEVLPGVNERVLRAEFLLAAMEHKVTRPDDAFILSTTLDGWATVTVDEKGKVEGLTPELFKELKEKKPFLFEGGTTATPPGDIGAGAQGAGGETKGPVDPARAAELTKRYGVLGRMQAAMGGTPSDQGSGQ